MKKFLAILTFGLLIYSSQNFAAQTAPEPNCAHYSSYHQYKVDYQKNRKRIVASTKGVSRLDKLKDKCVRRIPPPPGGPEGHIYPVHFDVQDVSCATGFKIEHKSGQDRCKPN